MKVDFVTREGDVMPTEKLEVVFAEIEGGGYAHAFLLYTDAQGNQFIARAWRNCSPSPTG